MARKEYFVPVYNGATGKFETVKLTEMQYSAFRRGEWFIKDHNRRFYKHEIQFSALAYGEDESGYVYMNSHEFSSDEEDPQHIVIEQMTSEAIAEALLELDERDLALILALIIHRKTVREYAKEVGEHRNKIQRRKAGILRSLRRKLEDKKIF